MPDSFFIFLGISIGVVMMSILFIATTYRDFVRDRKQHARDVRMAHDKGYSDGRKFRDAQIEMFEQRIDEIWYEIEELHRLFDKHKEKQNELSD